MSNRHLREIRREDQDREYVHDDGRKCAFSRPTGEWFLWGQGIGDDALCDRTHGTPVAIDWEVFVPARTSDPVQMPSHYTQLPVECIDVTEHFGFCLGNAIKYIWRADHKGKPVEDLEKAAWYIRREIERRKREQQ